jgi:drug/metabolite transporter (DMT)-like permease
MKMNSPVLAVFAFHCFFNLHTSFKNSASHWLTQLVISLLIGAEEGGLPRGALWALLGSLCYSAYVVFLRRKIDTEEKLDIPMFFGFVGRSTHFYTSQVSPLSNPHPHGQCFGSGSIDSIGQNLLEKKIRSFFAQ